MRSRLVGFALVALAAACTGMRAPPRPAVPTLRYGSVMVEIGQRFQQLGLAATSSNWPLLDYFARGLAATWEADLRLAVAPGPQDIYAEEEVVDLFKAQLRARQESFAKAELTALAPAIAARNAGALEAAFARAAAGCNACHRESGHPYIVIPSSYGQPVPQYLR